MLKRKNRFRGAVRQLTKTSWKDRDRMIILLVFDGVVVVSVQVHAEQKMPLQPIDSQSSDTNPQQPNSLLYLPHMLLNTNQRSIPLLPPICRHAHPGLVSRGNRSNGDHACKHLREGKAVVRDLRYQGVTGGSLLLALLLINNTTQRTRLF